VSLNQSAHDAIHMIKSTAAIIDTPYASPRILSLAAQPQIQDSTAEKMTIHQSLSLNYSLIDSKRDALCGKGFKFFPNTFFLRRRSFSSPTIPVLASVGDS